MSLPVGIGTLSKTDRSASCCTDGRYSGYDDTELATAASKLPGAAGLPAPPKNNQDMNGILNNSGYYNSELRKHYGSR
ncbi:MAG: hypothetical protein ABR555_17095 [Pyrinomonadaceae bacterium]